MNSHRPRGATAVLKAAQALKGRDILQTGDRGYRFNDPFFACYLRELVAEPASDMPIVS